MVPDWPRLNALAWLRLPCCDKEHPTRVEGYEGNHLSIAAPSLPHTQLVKPLGEDDGFFLGWVAENSARELPVSLISHVEEPLPIWTVTAIGDIEETQRRSYVRLSFVTHIKIYSISGGAPAQAMLLDISEGGLRCKVDKWVIDPGKDTFSVEIELEDRNYYLKARTAWWGLADGQGNREVGIRFVDIEPAHADSIRSYIFAAQLAERRRKLQ